MLSICLDHRVPDSLVLCQLTYAAALQFMIQRFIAETVSLSISTIATVTRCIPPLARLPELCGRLLPGRTLVEQGR